MNSNLTLKRSLLLSFLFTCLALLTLQAQTVTITAPPSVAGDYPVKPAIFGPAVSTIAGVIELADDGTGVTDGCDPVTNTFTGKIAMIDRGACGFVQKATNAEAAGAMALIVCNSAANAGLGSILMGGDDMGLLTIPSVMMSYDDCEILKVELATLAGTMNPPAPGEGCSTAFVVSEGTHTAPALTGGGSLWNDATSTAWYSYTPAMDGLVNINSCGGGVDTRLWVWVDGCDLATIAVAADNDDACDLGNGDPYASEVSFLGSGGTTYYISWDDHWDGSGFDFEISLGAVPIVDVEVTVDMENETVDPNGAHVAGSFNGWVSTPMTDNGDGTYTFTMTGITAGDTIEYKFQNGDNINWEEFAAGEVCTVTDPSGQFTNRAFIGPIVNAAVGAVCFNSCDACPPPACTDPDAIICDDFEMYTLDDISAQSAHWGPWSMVNGAGDDATVSDAYSTSGSQSLLVSAANGDDMLLLLGDQTTGNYLLQWKMYVPSGSTGYFNTQKFEGGPGDEYGMQVEFFADGTTTLDAGAADVVTATWEADTWMDIALRIDLTNDWMIYTINGEEIYSWPASWGTFAMTGTLQLGSVNFFGNTDTEQYIDDVLFKALPECPDAAVICDSYEAYAAGTTTGGQAPWWTTWSGDFGTAEDGIVSSDQAFDGSNSMLIGDNGIQDVVLALGDQTSGNWSIEMQMYVPDGSIGYFNIQETEVPGTQWNMEAWFNGNNASGYTAGMGQLASGETFATPQDTWFPVVNMIDLDNGTHTLIVDGVTVLDNIAYAGAQIGGLDFFSISGENTAYFDAIRFIELEPVVPDPVDVTFHVDMSQVVDAMPAFIAGAFNGWTGEAMTDDLDGTYSFTIALLPGETYEYKFQNGAGGWEGGIPAACSVGPDANRTVTVGASAMDIGLVCFNECAECVPIAVDETTFAAGLDLFPNPTANATNVTYNFNESLNLDITVSNTIGQQLYRTNLEGVQSGSHTIDLSNFTPGVYLVQMTDGKNNLAKRLVVQ